MATSQDGYLLTPISEAICFSLLGAGEHEMEGLYCTLILPVCFPEAPSWSLTSPMFLVLALEGILKTS